MTRPTVVIFAQEADAPVDAVVRRLAERDVAVFRADTSWFPSQLVLDAHLDPATGRWMGTLRTEHRSVELEAITSIWYRDPAAFRFPDTLTDVERAYAHREARLGFGGVLAALPVLWVNHPNRAADAVFKPLQLATAAACGLRVQPTLVTNSPDAARRFAAEQGEDNTLCKSFGPNTITEGDLKVAFAHHLAPGDLADPAGVASTATQLQRWVTKDYEARVIVVGERMFTILIRAGSPAAQVDWRADFPALTYEWVDTPPEIAQPVRSYMALCSRSCPEPQSSGGPGWV